MKRIFLLVFITGSWAGLMACEFRDTVRPPRAERSMSIAGMPVHEKDYRLNHAFTPSEEISKND